VGRRDHPGAGQLGAVSQGAGAKPDEIGDEQEQSADAGGELARAEGEAADVGDRLDGRSDQIRALLVEPPRQRREPLFDEDLAHRRDAEGCSLIHERLADLVN